MNGGVSSTSDSRDSMMFDEEIQHMTQEVLQSPLTGCFLTNSHLPQTIDVVDIVAVAHVPHAPIGIKDWNHRSVVLTDSCSTKALSYVLGRDKQIRVWDVVTGRLVRKFKITGGKPTGFAVSGDGASVVTCDSKGGVAIWRLKEENCEGMRLEGHSLEVRSICCCSTGRFAATVSVDCLVIVWDLTQGCRVWHTRCDSSPTVVSLTDDARILWWGDRVGRLHRISLTGDGVGKSDYEFMDALDRPITAIAHSTLHVASLSSNYAARHGADQTAVIVASIQVTMPAPVMALMCHPRS